MVAQSSSGMPCCQDRQVWGSESDRGGFHGAFWIDFLFLHLRRLVNHAISREAQQPDHDHPRMQRQGGQQRHGRLSPPPLPTRHAGMMGFMRAKRVSGFRRRSTGRRGGINGADQAAPPVFVRRRERRSNSQVRSAVEANSNNRDDNSARKNTKCGLNHRDTETQRHRDRTKEKS
jgi:hypothetical protein